MECCLCTNKAEWKCLVCEGLFCEVHASVHKAASSDPVWKGAEMERIEE
jgi:hypothetical protein